MSVVPLLLGDSDSLSVSYGMEPEQEALSIVSIKDREAASPVNKLNPYLIDKRFQLYRYHEVKNTEKSSDKQGSFRSLPIPYDAITP